MTNNPNDPDYVPNQPDAPAQPAGGWRFSGNKVYDNSNPNQPAYTWDANNVFQTWDLNPLAMQIGQGADGVRDNLSASRDAYIQPLMAQYRQQVGAGNSADDDQGLFNDPNFQDYVRTGQISKGYAADPTSAPPAAQPAQPTMQTWAPQPTTPAPTLQPTAPDPRADALYNTLLNRSQQSLTIDPKTDPNLRPQLDSYIAAQTRAERNAQSDNAEAAGPNANNRGYNRMLHEQFGESTGNFASSLIARELQTRRDEISQALTSMGGMLSQDQQVALQQQLAQLNAAIQSRGQDVQQSLGQQGINNDLQKTLLQNQQFNSNLNSQNQQFSANLGFNAADRANYWDALRSGLIGG